MFRTPPKGTKVKTRSVARAEREAKEKMSTPVPASSPGSLTQHATADTTFVAGSNLAPPSLRDDGVPHPLPPHSKLPSVSACSSVSLSVRKKKLELEAKKQKALLELEKQRILIEIQLETDLADLNDEKTYSPHDSIASSRWNIERWMEQNEHEQNIPQPAPENIVITGEAHQSAAPVVDSEGTIQMLAAAVKNLTVASAHSKCDANLLSRICTPRDLPEYFGDPLEWLYFKQAYEESTEVCKFSPKENLWRLRKCLRGQAKETVSALLMTAASPDRIMATLELSHGDPEYIVSRLIQDVKKLTPMSNDYQRDIVNFSVKVQNFVESVKAVGREEYVQGLSIVPLLISKLPTVLVSKWTDYSYPLIKARTKSRLSIMSDFLNEEAEKVATTANVFLQNYRTDPRKYNQQHDTIVRPQPILLQTEQQSDNDKRYKCLFCRTQQSHGLPDCKKFKRALRKDRWRYVKRQRLCFKCLLQRHDRESCSAPACDKEGCGGAHHKLLHYEVDGSARRPDDVNAASALLLPEPTLPPVTEPTPSSFPAQTPSATGATCFIENDKRVLLKVVPVKIHGPNGVFSTTALLDDGSSVSLLSANLAARAGLQGRNETMRVSGAWNNNVLVCESTLMTVNISSEVDSTTHTLSVRSVKQLDLPIQNVSLVDCDKYEHLKALKTVLLTNSYCKPELLIGQDNYHLLLPLEICIGRYNEPSATRTHLGWCVHGAVQVARASRAARSTHATLHLCVEPEEDAVARALRELHEEVRRSFAIDALGISGKPRQNANDVQAIKMLEESAVLDNSRWSVGLPWKDPHCSLPDSFPSAYKRLQGVERKMLADEAYAHRYEERVNHLFENDFAREMTDTSLTPNTWYLPHFGVDNPNKKKLRLVYDVAAKSQGKSLNDFLLTGPDLLASLFGIMLRFREDRVAVTGDIKDMFLRVKINSDDQNALRFLWRGFNPTGPVKTYAMTSLIFGANCSPFIAQFIKNKNASRFVSTLPAAVAAIHNQHYMDDYIDSLPDEPTAITMVKNIRDIHSAGGFEIRNWTCNSATVLDTIPKDILGTTAVMLGQDKRDEGERTLGLIWYPAKDELAFDVSFKRIPESVIKGEQRPTKRVMLRVVMSIFDVFGFLTPFTTQGKIMLQDTWRLLVNWDDIIPDELYKKWCNWIGLLKLIEEVRLPRWYQSCAVKYNESEDELTVNAGSPSTSAVAKQTYEDLELHIFSDASLKAMCAVAYWRWKNNDQISVAFVASKSRVSSVKPQTVPRLELQAALLAARLADSVAEAHRLHIARRYFWCDSSTVLNWIYNNTRQYKTFEANRLGEIDELTKASEWRYVPTGLNVADIATRESFNYDLFLNEWFKGPAFLYAHECDWPVNVIELENRDGFKACVTVVQNSHARLPVPNPERFSSWIRFVRSAASVLKFTNKCRGLTTIDDFALMEQALSLILRQAQDDSFASDLQAIKMGKSLPRDSRLLNLSPYLDADGILRMSGRIDAVCDVPQEAKRPVILDGRHPTTRLLVKHYHVKAAHGHQEAVVNDLKQKYWIIQLRPTVKRVIASHCMFCRIRKATPQVPRMGDLPQARMAHHQRAFTFCGIDLFGPMEVTVGRHREKRYGVLFTCLTVRAVHIEIAHSLTTDSLIMALRSMASRRGWPAHIYSDNGTNLRGADVELRRSIQELDEEVLRTEAVNNKVQWTFIPPVSPHWGGAWERLIRSVKRSLHVILKERAPQDETLTTLLTEVESIVNGRPLTHVSVEPGSTEALTPNHFLIGSSSKLPAIGVFNDSDLSLRKRWRIAQRLADRFWQRWLKEFLPQLLPRKKWQHEQTPLSIGDLVLVVDPDSPRNVWPRGIIRSVVPGKDGRIRVVEVTTASGVLRRSVARVAPVPLGD